MFPGNSNGNESVCNEGDLGSIPGLGRSPGEGKGYPLQYSGPENSMDCIVHGVSNSQTRLNDFHSPGMPYGTASPHPYLDEVNQSWSAFQGSWMCDSVGAVGGTLAGPDWRVSSKGKQGPWRSPWTGGVLCLCPWDGDMAAT